MKNLKLDSDEVPRLYRVRVYLDGVMGHDSTTYLDEVDSIQKIKDAFNDAWGHKGVVRVEVFPA